MKTIASSLLLPALLAPTAAAQWSVPVLEPNVNATASDFDPCPTLDGLTMYFSSSRTGGVGGFDIYVAMRTAPYTAFGAPALVMELCSTTTDAGPFQRIDGREIFFYSLRPGGGGALDLYRADRPSSSGPFNPPVPITELNTTASEVAPSLTIDGLRMYYSSTGPGGMGGYDIWTATRPNWSSPFGTGTPVVELNTSVTDLDPHISPDGLVIFFTSNRPGGVGASDTWMASRLDLASAFGTPVSVTALNTTAEDYAPGFGLYADEIYFTSTRGGGPGSFDIHSSRFTGLVSVGIAGVGSNQDLRFSDPTSPGLVYVAVASRGTSPGIPIDTRVLPLNFDLLFQLTVGGLPPVLTGYVGALNQDGIASGRISFAGFPALLGFRFFNGFVVLDPRAPSGIKTISNAHEVLVQ